MGLREHEDLKWFVFRYSNLQAMPRTELSDTGVGLGDRWVMSEEYRLKGYGLIGTAGKVKHNVGQISLPLVSRLTPTGKPQFFQGPPLLKKIQDTPLNRGLLYLNLLAYLAGYRTEPIRLFLNVPATINELQGNRKYPDRNLNLLKPHQTGSTLLKVDYLPTVITEWLAFARKHPDFNMDMAWAAQDIDYKS